MAPLSFKNRIALNYIITTGLMVFVVFFTIYSIVKHSVYIHIDGSIKIEIENHLNEIKVVDDKVILIDKEEWNEREHNTVDVNPVFVQLLDLNKKIIEKSPNLKSQNLSFIDTEDDFELFDTKMGENAIRQIQVPIFIKSKKTNYLIVAMSLTDSTMVLHNLFNILVISFPVILIIMFFIARFFAGKSIKPINEIINTSENITKDNLKTRISLPKTRDELYTLSNTINNLLNRIEDAILREKQFTSDASHELRTPLTVLKGTLEVLIRKPRTQAQYEDKINFVIIEVDRLNNLIDQLLLLARFENQIQSVKHEKIYLNAIISDILTRYSNKITTKEITINYHFFQEYYVESDNYLVSIIIGNIISNAIKYCNEKGIISILISQNIVHTICTISDNGIGIPKEDLDKVFNPFYRSNPTHSEKGSGLGLSIVKRISEILNIDFSIESELNKGTTAVLKFNKHKN